MAITARAAGTWSERVTNTTVAIPVGATTGDRMFLLAAWKTFSITATAGVSGGDAWTEITEFADGSVATGNGTGSMKVGCWYKDHDGSESDPTLTFSSTTGLLASAAIVVFQKGAGDTWDAPDFRTGSQSASSSLLLDTSSTVTVANASLVIALAGIRDDGTFDSYDITELSGTVTWNGATVQYPTTAFSTTTGNDMSCNAGYRLITTGASNKTIEANAGLAASETGAGLFIFQTVSSGSPTTNAPAENSAGTGAAGAPKAKVETTLTTFPTGTAAAANTAALVKPNADVATASGAAQNAQGVPVMGVISAATGTGAANNAAVQTSVPEGIGTGTGVANNATLSLGPTSGVSTGTGASGSATSSVAVSGGLAAATGAANNATIDTTVVTSANAEAATGVGAAGAAAANIQVNASASSGTGVANDATVSAVAFTNADAQAATGAGSAYGASVNLVASAGAATGTGAANNATGNTSSNVSATAQTATGTGAALQAGGTISASIGSASATGVAGSASLSIASNASAGTGSGAAAGSSSSLTATPTSAAGTGAANDATATSAAVVNANAETATGTGTAYDATIMGVTPVTPTGGRRYRQPEPAGLTLQQRDDEDILVLVM